MSGLTILPKLLISDLMIDLFFHVILFYQCGSLARQKTKYAAKERRIANNIDLYNRGDITLVFLDQIGMEHKVYD